MFLALGFVACSPSFPLLALSGSVYLIPFAYSGDSERYESKVMSSGGVGGGKKASRLGLGTLGR